MQASAARRVHLSQWLPVAVIFYLNGTVYGIWATQIPILKPRLGVSEAGFGQLLVAMGVGAVIAMGLTGRLLSCFGAARVVGWGFILFVLSLLSLSVATSPFSFSVALLLFGASGGMMDVAMNAYAAASEAKIGRPVMSSFHGMWNVGGLAGSIGGGLLLSYLSGPMQALALSTGSAFLFFLIRSRLTPENSAARSEGARQFPGGWQVWVIGILTALCFSAEGAVRDWSALYLSSELGKPPAQASWGYSVFSALMAAGRFTGDRARILVGERWTVVGSAVFAALGFFIAATASRYGIVLLGFGLIGIGLANIVPIFISAAGRLPSPSTSITIVVAMGYAGFLASPPVLGGVAGATSLAGMFIFIGGLNLLMALSWLALSRRR